MWRSASMTANPSLIVASSRSRHVGCTILPPHVRVVTRDCPTRPASRGPAHAGGTRTADGNFRALRRLIEVDSEPDEKLLVETAQRGPRRFADLYRLHFDRVYAYVARRVTTRSD